MRVWFSQSAASEEMAGATTLVLRHPLIAHRWRTERSKPI